MSTKHFHFHFGPPNEDQQIKINNEDRADFLEDLSNGLTAKLALTEFERDVYLKSADDLGDQVTKLTKKLEKTERKYVEACTERDDLLGDAEVEYERDVAIATVEDLGDQVTELTKRLEKTERKYEGLARAHNELGGVNAGWARSAMERATRIGQAKSSIKKAINEFNTAYPYDQTEVAMRLNEALETLETRKDNDDGS